jgi:hypothetical protein
MKMLHDLLDLLTRFRGKFLLSNYALPEILELAAEQNWNVQSFDKRLSAAKENGRRKTEILVSNYTMQQTLF